MPITRNSKRIAVIALITAILVALLSSNLVAKGRGDLSSRISAAKSSAATLSSEIQADSAQIEKTANGVAQAKAQLAKTQNQLDQRMAALRKTQTQLMEARDQLLVLEKKLKKATDYLASNLIQTYEGGKPNLVDVILNSHGFADLLQKMSFLKRVSAEDAEVVSLTQQARNRVVNEANRLGALESRDQKLTNQIMAQRSQVSALESALLARQIAQQTARARTQHKLSKVRAHLNSMQQRLNAIEAAATRKAEESTAQVNSDVGGIAVDTGGMVQPPAGAPEAVKEMIAAGNAIATLPYIWGGGHGSFVSPGYDCSGSVSYVLAAAGLLSAPEVAVDFESFGDAGAGTWVTIYAASDHVWMEIAGWRFDTVALAEDGTRWARGGGEFSGFVERHPAGL